MKKYSFLPGVKGILLTAALLPACVLAVSPNKTVLPDDFKVYYSKKLGVANKPFKGGKEFTIPTNNEYKDAPGCYVTCLSNQAKEDAIPVPGTKTYLIGQVRVEGRYRDGLCIPKGYESKDARKSTEIKEKCEQSFPTKCEEKSCAINTNTSMWFN